VSQTIKNKENIKKEDIENMYKMLVDQINAELANVKSKLEKQKVAEEQAKLKKIQQEMEAERRKKEAEDAAIRKAEEDRKQRVEMEAKRKIEEETRRRQEEKDRATLESMQKDLDNANAKLADQHEQERRDHELALRLAEEGGGLVEELPTPGLKRSSKSLEANSAKKYNLAKWKYAELRDTINTSCDIELLEACREEFHRRLKVYHAWKARNKKKNSTFDDNMRAPSSILNEANKPGVVATVKKSGISSTQRFFRIPFVKPGARDGAKGWWFAHFDGDWIGRQMELHPGRDAVLLVAGKDDMQMCELSLDDTGLTRKRGAEILEHEFEKEWNKNGGGEYIRSNERKKNGN